MVTDVRIFGQHAKARIKRTFRELSSLAIATVIVLSVCGVAIASMSSDVPLGPFAGIRVPWSIGDGGEQQAQLFASAEGLTEPVTYEARIDVEGWKNRDQRVVRAFIRSAEPVDRHASEIAGPDTVSPARVIAEMLTGRRVLAGATELAARDLPDSGDATVRLIVAPQGDTATLLIDAVLAPLPEGIKPTTILPLVPMGGGPVVDRLSRNWGRPGTLVTIEGSDFGDTQEASWVTCAGARSAIVEWSDTTIVFEVPADAQGSGYVGVVMGARTSNGIYFTPSDAPVVDAISPREGEPGTIVTLHGENFGTSNAAGWVSFAGLTAEIVSWSDSEIRVVVPRGVMAGWAGVVVNGLSSNGILYAPYGLPTIESISTRRLTRGLEVTVSGRDFGSAPGVLALNATRFTADEWTSRRIVFRVPAGVKSGYLGVLREDRYTSNGVWVNVVPIVSTVSNWWASPGSSVEVTGIGFGTDPSAFVVTVNRMEAEVTSWSDTRLTVVLPPSATTGYVGVGTRAACSNGRFLVVEERARIDGVTPSRVSGGNRITIEGSRFGSSSSGNRVLIAGRHECAVESWTQDRIVAVVPDGADSGYVGVIKQNVSSNGVWLTVTP